MDCTDLRGVYLEPREIVPKVFWVGVNDCVKDLFESLWPIPGGISYNAYTVIGANGAAVIDGVDEHLTYEYVGKIWRVVGDLRKIKYVVINHLEPDHHASTSKLLSLAENAQVLISPTGAKIVESLYSIPKDRIVEVRDGDTVSLGDKTLRFIHTPWLHWPETMMTYLEEDGILFSCDAFGSYGALISGIFDDEVELNYYIEEAKRYFSNIVSKYSKNVLDAINKVEKLGLKIKVLAPSHGPIYRKHVDSIVALYRDLSQPKVCAKVTIVYGSMYGRTEEIVKAVAETFEKSGVVVDLIDAARVHPSYILHLTWNSGAVIFAFPTYDASVFPPVKEVMNYFYVKQYGRGRLAAILNTFSWGSSVKEAVETLNKSGFRIVEPVIATKSQPTSEDKKKIEELVEKLVTELRKLGSCP
ncbi:MAG: FprA family A-type flavoprotein [Sulfolobales archaeon]